MFKHILVPIDLSDRNENALRTAFELAVPAGARVSVLHVITRVSGIPFGELKAFYDQLEAKAHARLSASLRKHAPPGIDARAVVLIGEPARDVVRWAERQRVGLIVIGSHSVEPKAGERLGWGTTSYKVALLCKCPVMLVKSPPSRRVRGARA